MSVECSAPAGRLEGVSERGLKAWRGIPYAHPPEGERRFRAPERLEPWAGVLSCKRHGPVSIQPAGLPGPLRRLSAMSRTPQSEDCLSLNVFAPRVDAGRRPVMVWIHGGGFATGSSGFFLYDPRDLVTRGDVVLVTLNYRLGALGGLDLRDLGCGDDAPPNGALRDQLAALEWVRDNVEAFGGDPENITLFGQSAGAMSIGALLAVPAARGLFRRAILQSGAARNVLEPQQSAAIAEQLVGELGLRARGPALLEALRSRPAAELLQAQLRVTAQHRLPLGMLAWQPVVDGDLVPVQPASAECERSSLPILIGTNADEWKMYTAFDAKRRALSEERLRDYVARTLEKEHPGAGASADRVIEIYRRDAEPRIAGEIWAAFQADRVFRHPALSLASRHAADAGGGGAYVYRFDYRPWLAPARVGACHSVEIPFVFGSVRSPLLRPVLGLGTASLSLSRRVQDAWLAFAKSGDPNGPGESEWPSYDLARRATRVFDVHDRVVDAPGEAARHFWDDLRTAPTEREARG